MITVINTVRASQIGHEGSRREIEVHEGIRRDTWGVRDLVNKWFACV